MATVMVTKNGSHGASSSESGGEQALALPDFVSRSSQPSSIGSIGSPLVCPGFTAPHTWPGFNRLQYQTHHVFLGKHICFFTYQWGQVTAVLPLLLLKAALRLGTCISIPVAIATGSKGGPQVLSGLLLNQARVVDQCIHVGTDI